MVTTNTKVDRREIGKERKALRAAQLDKAIENELLERLKQASETMGDAEVEAGGIFNYPENLYNRALQKVAGNFSSGTALYLVASIISFIDPFCLQLWYVVSMA